MEEVIKAAVQLIIDKKDIQVNTIYKVILHNWYFTPAVIIDLKRFVAILGAAGVIIEIYNKEDELVIGL
jgi:hypothetical protein